MFPRRHDARQLQFAVIMLWIAALCSGKTITISTSGANNETACLSGEYACGNLTMALVGGHNVSGTTVNLEPGSYTLERCDPADAFELVNNIAIIGLAADEVNVTCANGAGLTFLQSTNVTIANVSFYNCGYEHDSNSRNTTIDTFSKYKVSLYFQQCTNVTLDRVSVLNSKGIAVQFFATVGTNLIEKCMFANNTGENGVTVGGGVYIEFPYCLPSNESCSINTTTVPERYTMAGTFAISQSNFSYNEAILPKHQSRVFMVPRLSDHVAFGRGGGLSIFFKGHTKHTSVTVISCHFLHNKAIFGGGAFVDFQDNCHNNSVMFAGCTFVSNNATQQGGGLRLNLEFIISGFRVSNNKLQVGGTQFISNTAIKSGGGMFVGATRENASSSTNSLVITYSSWTKNIAQVGSAITMAVWHRVAEGTIILPILGSCWFNSNGVPRDAIHDKGLVGKGTIYLDSIPLHFEALVNFTNNWHSAIAGANTGIYFSSNTKANFINNRAHMGGAIALLGNAFLMVSEQTTLTFINNTAEYLGGAIYATSLTGQDSVATGDCFLRYYKLMTEPSQWKTNFIFRGNTAMDKNNSIYASSLEPCLWERTYGSQDDSKGLSSVFCWNNESKKWDYGNNDCREEIMSAPSNFHNNMPVVSLNVMPGLWKYFDLNTIDNLDSDVSDYTVFVARSATDGIVLGDHSHYLAYNAILLYQTNPSVTSGTVLLQTINTPDPIEAELDITFMKCPPGFNLTQPIGDCSCIAQVFNNLIQCNANATSDIQRGYWIGPSPYNNETTVMAHCPLCSYDQVSQSSSVSVDSFVEVQDKLCHSVNRTGTLCSKCVDGFCPAVNSELFDCVPYDDSYSFPLRIFFFILNKVVFPIVVLGIIYRFGITISSGKYNAPVFFAQMVTTVITVDADGIIPYPDWLRKVYFMVYDVWNLELRLPKSAGFCLHEDMSVTMVIALNYCVALLPLLVVIAMSIVYICYDKRRDYNCCSCLPQNESCCKKAIKAISWTLFSKGEHLPFVVAAFFVLSYMKIAITTCMLITPAQLIHEGQPTDYVLYRDGSQQYPHDIISYLVIAVVCCAYLVMVPLFLLFLRYGPTASDGYLHHLLRGLQADFKSLPSDQSTRYFPKFDEYSHEPRTLCIGKWREVKCNTTKELCSIDFECCAVFSGCFCSCSPHDFRWVSGAYFGLRILMLLPYAASPNAMVHLIFQIVICLAAAGFFAVFQPYGYNHGDPSSTNRQEMADVSVGDVTKRKTSLSEWYNRLDASVFIILAIVIALSIYRYYLSMTGTEDSIVALVVQSVLLFLPAVWFAICALHDVIWNRLSSNKEQLPTDNEQDNAQDQLLPNQDVEQQDE